MFCLNRGSASPLAALALSAMMFTGVANADAILDNPEGSPGAINYTINGEARVLQPGYFQRLPGGQSYVIEFDQGGDLGPVSYTLYSGTYQFGVEQNAWCLWTMSSSTSAYPAPVYATPNYPNYTTPNYANYTTPNYSNYAPNYSTAPSTLPYYPNTPNYSTGGGFNFAGMGSYGTAGSGGAQSGGGAVAYKNINGHYVAVNPFSGQPINGGSMGGHTMGGQFGHSMPAHHQQQHHRIR